MALRIELWVSDRFVDGRVVDGVEAVLAVAENSYALLDAVSPYGDFRAAPDRFHTLAAEARALAATTAGYVRH